MLCRVSRALDSFRDIHLWCKNVHQEAKMWTDGELNPGPLPEKTNCLEHAKGKSYH